MTRPADRPDADAPPGSASEEHVFELRGFSAYYSDFRAIRDIDLDVLRNRITAFIGPSGCGKTTLLRILLGLESADAGSLSHPPLDRAGYLPQGNLLLPGKRILENIELPMQLQGMGRDERRAQIRAHLPIFGLDGFESA